jgi:hypothetical protein
VQEKDRLDLLVWLDYPVDGGYIVLGPPRDASGRQCTGHTFHEEQYNCHRAVQALPKAHKINNFHPQAQCGPEMLQDNQRRQNERDRKDLVNARRGRLDGVECLKGLRVRSLEKKLVYYYAIGNWWNAEHVREEAVIG